MSKQPRNARGWKLSSGGYDYTSKRTTLLSAFKDWINSPKAPKRLGLIVEAKPVGIKATDENTYYCLAEAMLTKLGRWSGPSTLKLKEKAAA